MNAEMQIYGPAALPYQLQSQLLIKRPNQMPNGGDYSAHYNANYNANYNAEYRHNYNMEYNAISGLKLHYREHYPE
jgi:hypothetical protein